MANITAKVWKYISNDATIRRLLSRGLIKTRALAKQIIKDLELETSTETVVSAIRRYDEWETQVDDIYKKARDLLKRSTFSTKSNVACVWLKKDSSTAAALPKIFSKIDFSKGEILRIIQGELSIKIIIDERNLEKVQELIPKSSVTRTLKNLVEIDIIFDDEGVKTPGLTSLVSTEIASHGINMEEIMTCVPELIILIKEKDFLKTNDILFKLIKEI